MLSLIKKKNFQRRKTMKNTKQISYLNKENKTKSLPKRNKNLFLPYPTNQIKLKSFIKMNMKKKSRTYQKTTTLFPKNGKVAQPTYPKKIITN